MFFVYAGKVLSSSSDLVPTVVSDSCLMCVLICISVHHGCKELLFELLQLLKLLLPPLCQLKPFWASSDSLSSTRCFHLQNFSSLDVVLFVAPFCVNFMYCCIWITFCILLHSDVLIKLEGNNNKKKTFTTSHIDKRLESPYSHSKKLTVTESGDCFHNSGTTSSINTTN